MKSLLKYSDVPVSTLWWILAAPLLALGWLLPNHSLPWTTFHSDAWIAAVLGVIGLMGLIKGGSTVRFYTANLVTALAVVVPLLQFTAGLIPFFGQAFMASLYLAGFLLAQIAGQQWQQWKPVLIGDILFSAMGIAALVSVGLQLYQWLGLTRDSGMLDIWVIGFDGNRPAANLGQPNQLSTLLLWGLLAIAWGIWRKQLHGAVAAIFAGFLLIGLALAQSRTALLGLLLMAVLLGFWRPLGRQASVRVGVVAAAVFYFTVLASVPVLTRFLLLEEALSMQSRSATELRPAAWSMFLDAIGQRPWWGYGWEQVMSAHLAVGERHPQVGQLFAQTHNLFLDLMVWTGIPLGMFFSVCIVAVVVLGTMRVANTYQALCFMLIAVVGIHAMLELPLHYAYFLLPAGFFLGMLNSSLKIAPLGIFGTSAKAISLTIYLAGLLLLGLVVRDYLVVEESSEIMRFQKARVRVKEPARPPDVIALTQLRQQIVFFLDEPAPGASEASLQWSRAVTTAYPSSYNLMKLITLLTLNDKIDEARQWMGKASYVMDQKSRLALPDEWKKLQVQYPTLRQLDWVSTVSGPQPAASASQNIKDQI